MFWKMCVCSTNGAMPIQGAPSPPMCVRNEIARGWIVQPHGHGVAADAAAGDLAFEQQRGAVVRAAGAESRWRAAPAGFSEC